MISGIFDISMLIILFLSSFSGFYRGIITIIINLFSFISLIFSIIALVPHTNLILSRYLSNKIAIYSISGVVSYMISLMFSIFLNSKILSLFSFIRKSVLDRSLGLILGTARGFTIILILCGSIVVFTSHTYFDTKKSKNLTTYYLCFKNHPSWLQESITRNILEKCFKLCHC